MSFNLWTARYHGKPDHVSLFLETEPNGDGILYHVIGTVLNGMNYQTKPGNKPDTSASYVPNSAVCIGQIKKGDVARLEAVCESVPPPGKQMTLNGSLIDPSKPLRRCGEWVDEVVEELRQQEILH